MSSAPPRTDPYAPQYRPRAVQSRRTENGMSPIRRGWVGRSDSAPRREGMGAWGAVGATGAERATPEPPRRQHRRHRRRQLCVVDRPASGENLLLRAENQRERSLGGRKRQSYGLNAPRDDDGAGGGEGEAESERSYVSRPPCIDSSLLPFSLARFFSSSLLSSEAVLGVRDFRRSRSYSGGSLSETPPVCDGMSKENDGRARGFLF